MTDRIDTILAKVNAFHMAVNKQASSADAEDAQPCGPNEQMVDGECIPIQKSEGKTTMAETAKQPEKVDKKPEEKAAPAPAVAPVQTEAKAPEATPKTEIEQLRSDMKEQAAILSAITEKVSGLVLNTEVKGQAETLKAALDKVEKLSATLTSAQPQPTVQVKVMPFQTEKPVDMTPGFRSGNASMEELSDRYMHKWGIEIPAEEELPPSSPKTEEDPVKAELAGLKAESRAHSLAMKEIADKLTGLIAIQAAKPGALLAPANPAAPVIPLIVQGKKSESSDSSYEVVNWDTSMNKGKSFEERARLVQERLGLKENAEN